MPAFQRRHKIGEIVMIPHVALAHEPHSDTSEDECLHRLPHVGLVIAKARPAIVVAAANNHLLCLPMYTIHNPDWFWKCFAKGSSKLVYVAVPDVTHLKEVERAVLTGASRVVKVEPGSELSHAGYVNLGAACSLEHQRVIKKMGVLGEEDKKSLIGSWMKQFWVEVSTSSSSEEELEDGWQHAR